MSADPCDPTDENRKPLLSVRGERRSRIKSTDPGEPMTLITILLVGLVVAAGLYFNRRVWRQRQAVARNPGDGFSVGELTAPLATLAVLLIVFVLVQTFGSWTAAGRAEVDEATATLLLFRESDLVGGPRLRDELRREVVCYATSVIHQDWPAMGDRRISNVPTYWGARIRGTGVDLVRTPNESTAGKQIVERDGERAGARQNRLGEARPTVPGALSWLMLVAVLDGARRAQRRIAERRRTDRSKRRSSSGRPSRSRQRCC